MTGTSRVAQDLPGKRPPKPKGEHNILRKAVEKWYETLDESRLKGQVISLESLTSQAPSTYTIYDPMLLLPTHAFQEKIWKTCFQICAGSESKLWEAVTTAAKVTHLAVNAPIPTPHYSDHPAEARLLSGETDENVLRRPTNLIPLSGDFGPQERNLNPTDADFEAAFWVSTRQNGITQTWAPVHTMFSRGNIKEKARLLSLPSIMGHDDPCIALDLYAGIGYFAFSYAKTGVNKVLCFEISAWSIEGLRRGAKMNGWKSATFTSAEVDGLRADDPRLSDPDIKFLIFHMDNEKAVEIVKRIRGLLPPIRHVNCGLLPSSKTSWSTAVQCLDLRHGGWIHVHENLRLAVLQEESERIRGELETLASGLVCDGEKGTKGSQRLQILLDHVEKVKSYSPGVMHVVLDIEIRR